MSRCEDYPCCGHEAGDCPETDSQGRQRWRCVDCGKLLPLKASSSLCTTCYRRMESRIRNGRDDFDYDMNY